MNPLLLIGAFLGLGSVLMGAYSTHVLQRMLNMETMSLVTQAITYQQLHAIVIVAIGLYVARLSPNHPAIRIKTAGWALVLGVLLFSGGIYLTELTSFKSALKFTPYGGVSLMIGWVFLVFAGV